MSLEWLNDSGMRGMGSEWMNQVLSLYKRQHLIHSFRGHSWSFRCHSMGHFKSLMLNDAWMTEWQWNERFFWLHFFSPLPKTPSFPLIRSFLHHLKMAGMKNNIGMISFRGHPNHFHSFSLHSSQFHHSRMTRNDRMRVKWGTFFEAGQNP